MAAFIPHDDGRLPPLPLKDGVSVQPRAYVHPPELDELRNTIESTIEQQLHERSAASLLSSAHELLGQAASSAFHASNGATFRSIPELTRGLERMQAQDFAHHVNEARNDFATWVKDCFREPAKNVGELLRGKNQQQMLIVLHRLAEPLEKKQELHINDYAQPELPAPPVQQRFEPLPPPPIALPTPHEHVEEEIQRIRDLMKIDVATARDAFISLRTYVWQQLGVEDRRLILPALRDVYHELVSAR